MKTQEKIRSLIIDDERHARVLLKTLLAEYCPSIDLLDEADSVASAVEKIEKYNPDLIFLDIKLKNRTGFEILEELKNINAQIIFTTAYSEYAIKAFEFSAIHYLLKPINVEQLEKAVEKAGEIKKGFQVEEFLELMNNYKEIQEERISLPNRSGEEYVLIKDIMCCVASGSYTEIYFEDGKLLETSNLKTAEALDVVNEKRKAADRYQPITADLSPDAQMISGLKEGIKQLNIGDKATVFVPYHLAYGEAGRRGIPAKSNLIFEVEIIEILK